MLTCMRVGGNVLTVREQAIQLYVMRGPRQCPCAHTRESHAFVVRVRGESLLTRFNTYTDKDTDPERTNGCQSCSTFPM